MQQQSQQQQVADLSKHVLQTRNASLPAAGGVVISNQQFGRIRKAFKFDNKAESWKEWRTHFMTVVRESIRIMAEVVHIAKMRDIVKR